MSSRSNPNNGQESSTRLTGYLTDAEKEWWNGELKRVANLEGLRYVSMGTLFTRIAKNKLRLDLASLTKYLRAHRGRTANAAR